MPVPREQVPNGLLRFTGLIATNTRRPGIRQASLWRCFAACEVLLRMKIHDMPPVRDSTVRIRPLLRGSKLDSPLAALILRRYGRERVPRWSRLTPRCWFPRRRIMIDGGCRGRHPFFVTAERLLEHCIFVATSRGPRVRLVLGRNRHVLCRRPATMGERQLAATSEATLGARGTRPR